MVERLGDRWTSAKPVHASSGVRLFGQSLQNLIALCHPFAPCSHREESRVHPAPASGSQEPAQEEQVWGPVAKRPPVALWCRLISLKVASPGPCTPHPPHPCPVTVQDQVRRSHCAAEGASPGRQGWRSWELRRRGHRHQVSHLQVCQVLRCSRASLSAHAYAWYVDHSASTHKQDCHSQTLVAHECRSQELPPRWICG